MKLTARRKSRRASTLARVNPVKARKPRGVRVDEEIRLEFDFA